MELILTKVQMRMLNSTVKTLRVEWMRGNLYNHIYLIFVFRDQRSTDE